MEVWSLWEPEGPSDWYLFYLILFYLVAVISYFHSLDLSRVQISTPTCWDTDQLQGYPQP